MTLTELWPLVTEAICEADRQCQTLVNGIECGLLNVKKQFAAVALEATGKKLTEEALLAWLIRNRLTERGLTVQWEKHYPGTKQRRCDLVVELDDTTLWLEIKLAWKAWHECIKGPVYHNSSFEPYLYGWNKSHSFRNDFEKLERSRICANHDRAICLIGFDTFQKTMDSAVHDVAASFPGWQLASSSHWADRRNEKFRIAVWHWRLPGSSQHRERLVAERQEDPLGQGHTIEEI